MIFKYMNSLYVLLLLIGQSSSDEDTCSSQSLNCHSSEREKSSNQKLKRYLLYDVNPGEGFNLRRDVYMRIATLVKKLNDVSEQHEWNLVLPPWGPLYHWKTNNIGHQYQIKWSTFFDLNSLRNYVPVIELHDFLSEHEPVIDSLYYLQHYAEGWTDGTWEERANIKECVESPPYRNINGVTRGWFWGFNNIFAKDFHCVSIQGYSSTLKNFLRYSTHSVVMIDRAEVILHDNFGDSEYWEVRRSMTFSKKLISIGNEFRKMYLNSTDKEDKTERSKFASIERKAIGGPYISVHLRRQDFMKARPGEVPSIEFAAQQILMKMKEMNLNILFIASDASNADFEKLKQYIPEAKRFIPTIEVHKDILDGGVAIVDQWICAHSRFFIGTYESTFSFRIQEEREILGFPVESTFNRLCGDNKTMCTQPSKWTIVA